MKHCGDILEQSISRKHVKRKDLCEFVGIFPQALSSVLKKESIDAGQLERFCEYLGLDPAAFYDYRGPHGDANGLKVGSIEQEVTVGLANVSMAVGEKEMYDRLLCEKDARIHTLEMTVGVLQGIIGKWLGNEPQSPDE